MYLERKENLSVYYFIKEIFPENFIKIVDRYPSDTLELPTLAVEPGRIDLIPIELGNRVQARHRKWFINIFAKNESQRDEFGYRMLNELKDGILVYNYDEGFPPDVTPSTIGHLSILAVTFNPIKISPELVEKMYYRATLSFVATNDTV